MCLAPQQQGLAEGGPSAATHPSWKEASSQMFVAFGELRWGRGSPAAGQGAAAQMLSLNLLFLRSWAQVASALLLTFGCGRVSLGLDSAWSWGWWASPTLSCWVGPVTAQKRAFGSREEDV